MRLSPRRLAAALALTTSLLSPAAWAESLADAMVSAYRHSALLDQNRALLRAADEDVATAVSALRPVVQWTAEHRYSQVEHVDSTQTSLSLVAQLTLFDFGRRQIGIDAAKETVLATREGLIGIEQDVLLGAVQAYLAVRSAAQQVALQQNSVNLLVQEEQAARDRFDVGEITVTDVSLASARLAATRAGLAAARGNYEVAVEAYRAATGQAPGDLSAPPPLPTLPASLEAAQATAQATHPSIRQMQRQVAAAELGVAAAQAERNPTLSGSVSVGTTRSPDSRTGESAWRDSASVGLSMSQTIYSGGRLSSGLRRAMATRDAVRAGLLQSSRMVAQQVGTSYARIDVARAQIRAIEQQIEAAQQAYDGVREEATLGARTTLDVLDAEQDLLTARADRISAEADLQLAHYQLLAAMGLLTVEHLKLGIPTYDPSAYYNAVRDAPYTSSQGESLDRVLRAIGRGD